MKKFVFISVLLFLVVMPSVAFSSDFDGLWITTDPSTVLMVRESNDLVLIISLNLSYYNFFDGVAYETFVGTKNGNVISVIDIEGLSAIDADFTVTLTSETTASVTVNRCTPKAEWNSCTFPASSTFQITKFF